MGQSNLTLRRGGNTTALASRSKVGLTAMLHRFGEAVVSRGHTLLTRKASSGGSYRGSSAKRGTGSRGLVKAGHVVRSAYAFQTMPYNKLVREGYEGNVIVYRCITIIAKAAASVGVCIKDKQGIVASHPFLGMLQTPSFGVSWSTFMEELISSYLLTGNVFIEILPQDAAQGVGSGGSSQLPGGLSLLRPDRMEIKPGSNGFPQAYLYRVDGIEHRIDVDQATGFSPIIHIKSWNPSNDWYGLSPLQGAARAVDSHNAISQHNVSLLKHGGRPSGALIVKPGEEGALLTEENFETFKNDLRDFYEGEDNAGRMLVLEGNLEWKEMGLSPKSMDFVEGKLLAAREIAQAFGVPSMLVGVPGDTTFSNYREARYHLWEETILPLLDHILQGLTHGWLHRFGRHDLRLGYDIETINALGFRREQKWGQYSNVTFLTINEKRAAMGYPPIEGGDAFSPDTVTKSGDVS